MIKLENTSEFLRSEGSTNWWHWTAYIDSPDEEELDKIAYVEYHLHSSFKNPVKRVRKMRGGFPLTMKGWGTFQINARVVFKDKNTKDLSLSHQLKFT
jgi:transcription initiation factor IIF auxiliary subunit